MDMELTIEYVANKCEHDSALYGVKNYKLLVLNVVFKCFMCCVKFLLIDILLCNW